jgi:hypothetical protein
MTLKPFLIITPVVYAIVRHFNFVILDPYCDHQSPYYKGDEYYREHYDFRYHTVPKDADPIQIRDLNADVHKKEYNLDGLHINILNTDETDLLLKHLDYLPEYEDYIYEMMAIKDKWISEDRLRLICIEKEKLHIDGITRTQINSIPEPVLHPVSIKIIFENKFSFIDMEHHYE